MQALARLPWRRDLSNGAWAAEEKGCAQEIRDSDGLWRRPPLNYSSLQMHEYYIVDLGAFHYLTIDIDSIHNREQVSWYSFCQNMLLKVGGWAKSMETLLSKTAKLWQLTHSNFALHCSPVWEWMHFCFQRLSSDGNWPYSNSVSQSVPRQDKQSQLGCISVNNFRNGSNLLLLLLLLSTNVQWLSDVFTTDIELKWHSYHNLSKQRSQLQPTGLPAYSDRAMTAKNCHCKRGAFYCVTVSKHFYCTKVQLWKVSLQEGSFLLCHCKRGSLYC